MWNVTVCKYCTVSEAGIDHRVDLCHLQYEMQIECCVNVVGEYVATLIWIGCWLGAWPTCPSICPFGSLLGLRMAPNPTVMITDTAEAFRIKDKPCH